MDCIRCQPLHSAANEMIPHKPAGMPSNGDRWIAVEDTMRRNGYRSDALIETLHTVQSVFGYLDPAALLRVADALNVARSRAHGVATFYHFFRLRPPATHVCTVCSGTACHIRGADALLDHVAERFGLRPGEATPGNELSLETVRCIGACALAPVVTLDGQVLPHASAAGLDHHLQEARTP